MDKNSNLAPVCYVGFSYCRVEGKIEFIAGDLLKLQALLLVQDLIEMLAGQLGWKCKIWGNVRWISISMTYLCKGVQSQKLSDFFWKLFWILTNFLTFWMHPLFLSFWVRIDDCAHGASFSNSVCPPIYTLLENLKLCPKIQFSEYQKNCEFEVLGWKATIFENSKTQDFPG